MLHLCWSKVFFARCYGEPVLLYFDCFYVAINVGPTLCSRRCCFDDVCLISLIVS